MRGLSIGRAISALVALAALVVATAAIAAGADGAAGHPRLACSYSDEHHTLSVRVRDELLRAALADVPPRFRDRLRDQVRRFADLSGMVTIERRIDELTVLSQPLRPPVSCAGDAPPRVTSTDRVRIATGRHSRSADLFLDLAHGALAPGFTDEGDGDSEIEVEAKLGFGIAAVRMTRAPDRVEVAKRAPAGPTDVNLNAGESTSDFDLAVGAKSSVVVDAAGGADLLTVAGAPAQGGLIGLPGGLLLVGGQGADELVGGSGSEGFAGGPGADRVLAGPGDDFVFAGGHAPDRIDCGPGRDLVLLGRGADNDLRRCERQLYEVRIVAVDRPARRFSRSLQRLRAIRLLSRVRDAAAQKQIRTARGASG